MDKDEAKRVIYELISNIPKEIWDENPDKYSMALRLALDNLSSAWISISDKQPQGNGYYLTTTVYKQVFVDHWIEDHFDRTELIIAWQPLPEPYTPEVE